MEVTEFAQVVLDVSVMPARTSENEASSTVSHDFVHMLAAATRYCLLPCLIRVLIRVLSLT